MAPSANQYQSELFSLLHTVRNGYGNIFFLSLPITSGVVVLKARTNAGNECVL
jgi:hypothetical protein